MNSLMFKLVLEKAAEPEIKLPTSAVSWKKQEFQKNIYFCCIDYAKASDCVNHDKLWKILKEMELPVKESYLTQNSLELKLPSRSSLPVYVKQRTLTQRKKQNGH